MGIVGDTSFPCDTFNIALHLAASLLLIGQGSQHDHWREEFGVSVARTVCGRGREVDEEEVMVVLSFFQEVTKDLQRFKEVLRTAIYSAPSLIGVSYYLDPCSIGTPFLALSRSFRGIVLEPPS